MPDILYTALLWIAYIVEVVVILLLALAMGVLTIYKQITYTYTITNQTHSAHRDEKKKTHLLLQLWNSGSTPIKARDFQTDSPLIIQFHAETEIEDVIADPRWDVSIEGKQSIIVKPLENIKPLHSFFSHHRNGTSLHLLLSNFQDGFDVKANMNVSFFIREFSCSKKVFRILEAIYAGVRLMYGCIVVLLGFIASRPELLSANLAFATLLFVITTILLIVRRKILNRTSRIVQGGANAHYPLL